MSSISEAFDALADATRTSANPPQVTPTRPDTSVSGRSTGDAITAHLTRGRVTRIDIRDHALSRDPHELGDLVAEAVNRALDAHDAAVVADLQAQKGTDMNRLSSQLDEIGREAQRSLETYLSSMESMLKRVSDEAQR